MTRRTKRNQRALPAGSQEGRHVHQGLRGGAAARRGPPGRGARGRGGGGGGVASFIRGAYERKPEPSTPGGHACARWSWDRGRATRRSALARGVFQLAEPLRAPRVGAARGRAEEVIPIGVQRLALVGFATGQGLDVPEAVGVFALRARPIAADGGAEEVPPRGPQLTKRAEIVFRVR